jgi:hypothetical protein
VNRQRLAHDFAHAHPRVQRSKGILKNHLHLPPLLPQFFAAERQQILPVEFDFAGIRLDKPQKHSRKSSLAATAFPDHSKGFPGFDGETYAVHS